MRPRAALALAGACAALLGQRAAAQVRAQSLRVFRTSYWGSPMNLGELELLTPDGANAALRALCTGSSEHTSGQLPASNLCDGALANYYHTHDSAPGPHWAMVTLPVPTWVSTIRVTSRWRDSSCCTNRDVGDRVELYDEHGAVVFASSISAFSWGSGAPQWTAAMPASPSSSATGSGSSTSTGTPSSSTTPPPSGSGTASARATRPATTTATPTATAPICRAPVASVVTLSGVAGATSARVSLARDGSPGLYTSGTCSTGLRTFYAGPRAVFRLQLGEGVPLGGSLVLTTCGLTSNNTVLYVGTGCPTWSQPFGCLAGNDDAQDAGDGCAGNERASTITLAAVGARSFFVQLGGYDGAAAVVSGLRWNYTLPLSSSPRGSASARASRSALLATALRSASTTASRRSPSRSASATAPRSPSRSATPSRSRKRK